MYGRLVMFYGCMLNESIEIIFLILSFKSSTGLSENLSETFTVQTMKEIH